MADGFIVIHRKIKDWKWWHNPTARSLWLYLLVEANWKDGYLKDGTLIPRGSLARSLRNIAAECELSVNTVRYWLNHFETTHEITRSTTHGYTVIKIVNYGKYQDYDGRNNTANHTLTDTPTDTLTDTPTDTDRTRITKKQEEQYILHSRFSEKQKTDEVSEIVDYLNQRTGSRYKSSTPKTRKLIQTRLKEKFTVQDFKDVIDKKCVEWTGTKMEKYLRPETLFGTKFEGYLNQTDRSPDAFYKQVELQMVSDMNDDDELPF